MGDPIIKPKPIKPVHPIDTVLPAGWADDLGTNTGSLGQPTVGDTGHSKYDNFKSFVDPNFIDTGHPDPEISYGLKQDQLGYNRASQQGWLDKLGNGLVKFGGSFADGVLSTVGTIYGAAASIGDLATGNGISKIWDNPFSKLGDDIQQSISNNFVNYRPKSEAQASAWSPKYWATWNFITDNIIGNLGFAAAGWVTGAGVMKILPALAPWIALGEGEAGMAKATEEGIEALNANKVQAYLAQKTWNGVKQGLSIGISASGEASTEAIQTYRETKKTLTDAAAIKYGGVENIPDIILQQIDDDSHSAGNIDYGMNLPIIAGADMIQWGRSIVPVSAEIKAFEKNPIKVATKELLGQYTKVEEHTGVKGVLKHIGEHLKESAAEALQEGQQYFAQQGTENWYQRKNDPKAWNAVNDYMDPYLKALQTLVTTQEGVANILGGAAGGGPFAVVNYIQEKMQGVRDEDIKARELQSINQPYAKGTIKENLKVYLENMARHAAAQQNLNESLSKGDTHGIHNAKFDILKSYINSRIMVGRSDLLNSEIEQLRAMNTDEFTKFFNIDPTIKVNKDDILNHFRNTAQDMHDSWRRIDVLFNPSMVHLDKLSKEDKAARLEDLDQYKSMLWNYMMDYKDRESRSKKLDEEINQSFGGLANITELMADKFGSNTKLNNLYKQYVAASFENNMRKQQDTTYHNSSRENKIQALQGRIRSKINDLTQGKPGNFLKMEDFMGPEKNDYVENYMFNLDKTISPLLRNPIVQASMNLSDIHQTIGKIHDLAQLHAERRMAIHSYNQLANMVKNNEYLSRTMPNPDYNEEQHGKLDEYLKDGSPNPDYVEKIIPSREMLYHNGYKDNENERRNYYNELQAREDANKTEEEDFRKQLGKETDNDFGSLTHDEFLDKIHGPASEEQKAFDKKVSQYRNGSKATGKSLKSMSLEDFVNYANVAHKEASKEEFQQKYAYHTKELRDKFDHAGFINRSAQLRAIEQERVKRQRLHEAEVEVKANDLADYYYANKLKETDLKAGMVTGNSKASQEVIDRTHAIIKERDDIRAETERQQNEDKLNSLKQGVMPVGKEGLVTNAMMDNRNEPKANGSRTFNAQDLADVATDLVNKIKAGKELLTDNEEAMYNAHTTYFDKKLKAAGFAGLVIQPKQSVVLVQPEPFMPSDETQSDNIDSALRATTHLGESMTYTQSSAAFIRLQRNDLQITRTIVDGKIVVTNVYNQNGKAQTNQLTNWNLFTQPNNKMNFNNNPRLRFIAVPHETKKGEAEKINKTDPLINLEVHDGKKWQPTGYQLQGVNDLNDVLIPLDKLDKTDKVNNNKLAEAATNLLKKLQKKIVANMATGVEMVIRGEPGFGNVIENQRDSNDEAQRMGLRDISGSLNIVGKSDSPIVAVISQGVDKNKQAALSYHDEGSGVLTDITAKVGVAVHPSLIQKVATANDKDDRAGQYVLLLPLGRIVNGGGAYEYFPVLLSGKKLNAHTTAKYDVGLKDGQQANMGHILIDALLNPWKPQYASLMKDLFEMSGLKGGYKGNNSDWDAFYQDKSLNDILNRLMFTSNKSLDTKTQHLFPFNFEVAEKRGADSREGVKIKIGITDGRPGACELYITNKDGSLKIPAKGEEAGWTDKLIEANYTYRKDPKNKTKEGKAFSDIGTINYSQIQDVLTQKAFHVQIAPMSQKYDSANPKATPAFVGFHLNEDGLMEAKRFDNYFHYVDELGLAQTTVQSVVKDGIHQYFVNQATYFVEKPDAPVEQPESGKSKIIKQEIDPLTAAFGPATTLSAPVANKKGTGAIKISSMDNAPSEEVVNKSMKTEGGIDETVKATPGPQNSSKAANSVRRNDLNDMSDKPNAGSSSKKGMIDPNVYTSIGQSHLKFGGSASAQYGQAVSEELSAMILDDLMYLKGRGSINAATIKARLLSQIKSRRYALMQQARPELANVDEDAWEAITDPKDKRYGYLLDAHIDHLERINPELVKQYDALRLAEMFDDIDHFIAMDKEGTMNPRFRANITIKTKQVGVDENKQPIIESQFFIGFLNKALINIMSSNIIQVFNKGTTDVDIDATDGSYTQRFNDQWALQVNPKRTLAINAKMFLQSIPKIDIVIKDGKISSTKINSLTGYPAKVRYDAMFNMVVSIGLASNVTNFEANLMKSQENENSPALFSLRQELGKIQLSNPMRYNQIIQQLAVNVLSLRSNGMFIVQTEMNDADHNAKSVVYSSAKTRIGNQIVATWESQVLNAIEANNYTSSSYKLADNVDVELEHFTLNSDIIPNIPTPDGDTLEPVDFADAYRMEVRALFKRPGSLSFDDYVDLAKIVQKRLGIELVEDDFRDKDNKVNGYKSAFAFMALNEKGSHAKAQFALITKSEYSEVKSFDQIFTILLGKYVADTVRDGIVSNTYDQDSPLKGSSAAMDVLAKIFQAHFTSVTSSQAPNIEGDSESTLITASMLSEMMKSLKEEKYQRELLALPIGKYNYFLKHNFEENPTKPGTYEFKPMKMWSESKADLVNGISVSENNKKRGKRNKGLKNISDIDIDIASMQLYHNAEDTKPTTLAEGGIKAARPMGWYYSPFGESVAGSVVLFKKFHFSFDYTQGKLNVKDGQQGSREMKSILYSHFKSEVNSIRANIDRFDLVNNNPELSLEQKKAQLQQGYDYIEIPGDKTHPEGLIRPGSGSYQYYYGKEANKITEDHPLYEVGTNDDNSFYPVGLKQHLKGAFDDIADQGSEKDLYAIFESQLERVLSNVVGVKIAKLMPYINSMFSLKAPKEVKDDAGKVLGYRSPEWKTNFFDNNYTTSIMASFAKESTIDGKAVMTYASKEQEHLYPTPQEAIDNGFHVQLLKAMVIDQQVNHFMYSTNLSQLTWDYAQFDKDVTAEDNWKGFVDNLTKREKAFNSPHAVSPSPSLVRSVVFNDVSYGQRRVSMANPKLTFNKEDKALITFMNENGLSKWLEGNKIPMHYKELAYHLYYDKKAGKSDEVIAAKLKGMLESKITDGGSFITLREYLYQSVVDGTIRADQYFKLYDAYSHKEGVLVKGKDGNEDYFRELSTKDRKILRLPAKKMAATGVISDGNRKVAVFIKDGKMILLPAQFVDTKFEQVIDDLHEMEKADADIDHGLPTIGYHLIPASAVKIGNAHPIDLFDEDGDVNRYRDPYQMSDEVHDKYMSTDWDANRKYDADGDPIYTKEETDYEEAHNRENLHAHKSIVYQAPLFTYNRRDMGEQVQNPDKNSDKIAVGTQLQNFIFNAIDPSTRYAIDKFGPSPVNASPTGRSTSKIKGIDKISDRDKVQYKISDMQHENIAAFLGKDRDMSGMSGLEMSNAMLSASRRLHESNLQDYINDYGLTYSISQKWRDAYNDLNREQQANNLPGFANEKEFQDYIDDLLDPYSENFDKDLGRHLQFIKFETTVDTIVQMMKDIKAQAMTKNVDPSQLAILNEIIETSTGQQLKHSLTYTPGNKQFQNIVVSKIQGLTTSVKRKGFSGVQASSIIFDKANGDQGLKGYGLRYDADNNVTGFDYAEVGVPWNFRDASNNLLDYNKYCNEDGTIKMRKGKDGNMESMIDDELLNLVSYRIPNTGPNMSGMVKIARFMKPNYSDIIAIPDSMYSRTSTDLDFDKLYAYSYNHTMDATGRLTKIKGVLSMKQKDAFDVLDNQKGINNVMDNILNREDPNYRVRSGRIKAAYKRFMEKMEEMEAAEDVEEEQSKPVSITQLDAVSLQQIKDRMDYLNTLTVQQPKSKQERKADEKGKDIKAVADQKIADQAKAKKENISALEEQYKGLIKDHNDLQAEWKARSNWGFGLNDKTPSEDEQGYADPEDKGTPKEGFNMRLYLTQKPDNYLDAQSYEQLENAYIDVYQHILGDPATQAQMNTPVDTNEALKYINGDDQGNGIYSGTTFREFKENNSAMVPNSEAFKSLNASMNNSGNTMVGALANTLHTAYLMQKANVSLGTKVKKDELTFMKPIVFKHNNGSIITESGKEPGRFTNKQINALKQKAGYYVNPMTLTSKKKEYIIPNRLNRILDNKGNVPIQTQMLGILQAYLDRQKTPEIVYSNINMATINGALAMNFLGYVDELFPFVQQEVIEDYSRMIRSAESPFIRNAVTDDMIYDYLDKAGIITEKYRATGLAAEEVLDMALQEAKRGEAEFHHEKYFSENDLKSLIDQRIKGKQDQDYYLNQAYVLSMFLRLKSIGEQMFDITSRTRLDSQGYPTKTILGIKDHIAKANAIQFPTKDNPIGPNLIGGERIGPYNKETNPHAVQTSASVALHYAKSASSWLDTSHNMFSDLTETFNAMRSIQGEISQQYSLGQKERSNISIIKYVLSNPYLYTDFLDNIPEADRGSAHDIRKYVFTDLFSTDAKGNPVVRDRSLARRINDARKTKIADTEETYGQRYNVLNLFKTMVKKPGKGLSWVYNFNSNSFREQIGQETASDVYNMLADDNPDIKTIAEYLFLYYYLGSGTTSPQSFGHLLPQEFLMAEGGFADKLHDTTAEWDQEFKLLRQKVQMNTPEIYDKPRWFTKFDKDIVGSYNRASNRLRSYYVQTIQNSRYDSHLSILSKTDRLVPETYTAGTHFIEEPDSDIVTLTPKGSLGPIGQRFNPASFLDDDSNVYVINNDYTTYTRYNRAGTPTYSERDAMAESSDTLIALNALRFKAPASDQEDDDSAAYGEGMEGDYIHTNPEFGDAMDIMNDIPEEPFNVNRPNSAMAIMQTQFGNKRVALENLTPGAITELVELEALGKAIMPLMPAGLVIIPMSVKQANKASLRANNIRNSDDGMLSVNGFNAWGFYQPTYSKAKNNFRGEIQIAYGYIKNQVKQPLLLKQTLLHETIHAAWDNVHDLVGKAVRGEMKEREVADLLDLQGEERINQVKQMKKAYERNRVLYDHLNNNGNINQVLRNAYRNEVVTKQVTQKQADAILENIMSSEEEMVARMFSDRSFRIALGKVEYKQKSALTVILEYIARLLGFDKDFALYHAFNNVFSLLEPVSDSKVTKTGFTQEDRINIGVVDQDVEPNPGAPDDTIVKKPMATTTKTAVTKIISGGQTGVDRLGLEVGKELGITTGGIAPKGYKTETGNDKSLKDFGLTEHTSRNYNARTEENIKNSDATVIFGDISSPGTKLTRELIESYNKPSLVNPSSGELTMFLNLHDVKTLNVAGNRGSKLTAADIEAYKQILRDALRGTNNKKALSNEPGAYTPGNVEVPPVEENNDWVAQKDRIQAMASPIATKARAADKKLSINASPRVTGDPTFDKYISATTDYIIRLGQERKIATDRFRKEELRERITKQNKILDQLKNGRSTRLLIQIGTSQVEDTMEHALQPDADLIELTEGLRIADAWKGIIGLINSDEEGMNETEVSTLRDAEALQLAATKLSAKINNKLIEKIISEASARGIDMTTIIKDGQFEFKDIDSWTAKTIDIDWSTNPLEQLMSALRTHSRDERNAEHFDMIKEQESKTLEFLGSIHAKTDFLNEVFDMPSLDSDNNPITIKQKGIISMYDRAFEREYDALQREAVRTKKWKTFYNFENKNFTYEINKQGYKDFDNYMVHIRNKYTTLEEDGTETVNTAMIDKIYKRFDPQVFRDYLDSKVKEPNAGGTFFVKTPKGIKLNPAYERLTPSQKEYHAWFTSTLARYHSNTVFDYKMGDFDMDGLLHGFITGMDKPGTAKYIGQAAVTTLKNLVMVVAKSDRSSVTTRSITGQPHVSPVFKTLASFLPTHGGDEQPGKVLADFIAMAIGFKSKSKIEEILNVINDIAIEAKTRAEQNSHLFLKDKSGRQIAQKGSKNTADRIEYALKEYIQGSGKEENKTVGNVAPGERGFSVGQLFDSVNSFTRMRFMALSPLSAAGNLLMGVINNYIYGAASKYYTDKQMFKAALLMRGASVKFISDNLTNKKLVIASDQTKLIADIMYRYNIIGDVTEELDYGGGGALSKLYALQKGGEFLVQGGSALAQMFNTPVDFKSEDGSIRKGNFFEIFSFDKALDRSIFNTDKLADNSPYRDVNMVNKLMQQIRLVNQKIHGDYAGSLLGKKTNFGRMLFMFRTWVPMSIKERFGEEYEHAVLGTQKGRYRSIAHLVRGAFIGKDGKWFKDTNNKDLFKSFLKLIPFANKHVKLSDRISKIDQENINMFFREVQMVLALMTATMTAKAAMSGDDDDKDSAYHDFFTYLTNQSGRLQQELSMYFLPSSYSSIMQNLLPVSTTFTDVEKLIKAMANRITDPDSDEYQNGFREGQSKWLTKLSRFVPVTRSVETTWAAFNQLYNNNNVGTH